MCGIIGYVGGRASKPLLIQGLERLEYRGYDSAGIALLEEHGIDYIRAVGNLQNLKEKTGSNGSQATTGLGHTRWATHGGVTEENAHPLEACHDAKLSIVLNGIVENYRELRDALLADGHTFRSETDAEVVAHLLEEAYDGDLVAAVSAAYARLEGHFTFVVIHHDHPDHLVGVRHQTPMVVGLGDGRELPRLESRGVPRRDTACAVPRTTARSFRSSPAESRSPMRRPARRSSTTCSRSTGTTQPRSDPGTRRSC